MASEPIIPYSTGGEIVSIPQSGMSFETGGIVSPSDYYDNNVVTIPNQFDHSQ